jgi:hypothetical protein
MYMIFPCGYRIHGNNGALLEECTSHMEGNFIKLKNSHESFDFTMYWYIDRMYQT